MNLNGAMKMYSNFKTATPSFKRQQWLEAGLVELRKHFTKHGYKLPATLRVSIGWPHGARGGKGMDTIGQCWFDSASTDSHYEIFISPTQSDGARIIDILAHELVHVVAGPTAKHGSKFKSVAVKVGLAGKMTETIAGEAMKEFAQSFLKKHGKYPAGALQAMRKATKQTTRLLKCECEDCGYVVRTTSKWINEAGTPICGVASHGKMKCEGF